ncbi:MAG: glutamine synthetase [SAR324 cluster bacterium]|nr:glutamine synthetase [SAR324 cluster bacterium]
MESIKKWFIKHNISEVECIIPDITGIQRGKIMPASKFTQENGIRIPESIFTQTVTGDWPDESTLVDPAEFDMLLRPDADTIRIVPWAKKPRAQIIHDCYNQQEELVSFAPRSILRKILKLYEDKHWQPVVAPELEFFLTKTNPDPDYPLEPPVGRSGRQEIGRQPYGIEALDEFTAFYEDIYKFCDAQNLDIDTLIHEGGAAQLEINFLHGEPLSLADQSFLFKRTVREAAIGHQMYATFMAKPMENEAGSSMHIHQSILDKKTHQNIFINEEGKNSNYFFSYIAGLQKYLPAAMPFFAPNVNSFRRFTRDMACPINVHWGYDNRTVGLRIPFSSPENTRVENRVAGADANPYLAIALTLACGYLGMEENLEPTPPFEGNAYDLPFGLPRTLHESLRQLKNNQVLQDVLGEQFVRIYIAVKEKEYQTYYRVISPWEREFLLLNV